MKEQPCHIFIVCLHLVIQRSDIFKDLKMDLGTDWVGGPFHYRVSQWLSEYGSVIFVLGFHWCNDDKLVIMLGGALRNIHAVLNYLMTPVLESHLRSWTRGHPVDMRRGLTGLTLFSSSHCTMCLWPPPEGAVSGILNSTTVLCSSLQSGSLCAAVEVVSALNCSGNWTWWTHRPNVLLLLQRSINLKLILFHVILHTWARRVDTCVQTFLHFYLLFLSSIPCRISFGKAGKEELFCFDL